MSQGVGQAAADKMGALFIMLKDGNIKEKKNTVNKKSAPKKAPTKAEATTTSDTNSEATPVKQPITTQSSNRPNLHIDLQIHISPESSPEQIESIFASMAKHLYGENK